MGYFMVNVQLPDAASLQRSDAVTRQVEKIIAKHPEVEYVTNATGYSMLSSSMGPNYGFLFISLKDWDQRDKTADDLVNELNKEFYFGVNQAQVFAFAPPAIPGLGTGSGFTFMLQGPCGQYPGVSGAPGQPVHCGSPKTAGNWIHSYHLQPQRAPEAY